MPNSTLTDARVKAFRPRKTVRDIRDGALRGFGVRVLSSGRKRFFVHCQHRGERIWKIVGDADTMSVAEARSCAGGMLAAIRRGQEVPRDPAETLFEAVAETVFRRHERVWKARTMYVNRGYLRNQILPRFAGRQIVDIERRDVRNWFASLRATPVAADRSMPVLSVIMREAEAMGIRPEGSNPCRGIRRYRRKGRERFLSDDEIRRLSAALPAHAAERPRQIAVIRLLLLTGCRKGEILTLRWSDYREGRLFLRDSKSGPRTVWLSQPARDVLAGLGRTSRWVFPSSRGDRSRTNGWVQRFWCRVRAEADLSGVRLHDLRHQAGNLQVTSKNPEFGLPDETVDFSNGFLHAGAPEGAAPRGCRPGSRTMEVLPERYPRSVNCPGTLRVVADDCRTEAGSGRDAWRADAAQQRQLVIAAVAIGIGEAHEQARRPCSGKRVEARGSAAPLVLRFARRPARSRLGHGAHLEVHRTPRGARLREPGRAAPGQLALGVVPARQRQRSGRRSTPVAARPAPAGRSSAPCRCPGPRPRQPCAAPSAARQAGARPWSSQA